MSKNPIIEVQNLSKSFGSNHVLDQVDLQVFPGESLVIIGQSGMGKSVFLRLILGLHEADGGEIKFHDQSIDSLSGKKKAEMLSKIGMLFQGGALFDSLPVWENVGFGLIYNKKMKRKVVKEKIVDFLEDVGLAKEVADLYPSELSGGMQKRVSLARTIATSPEVLFFDEPTTGLDPIMTDVISLLIKKLVKQLGATAVTISHDMDCVSKIADRVVLLDKGKFIWQGTLEEMKKSDLPKLKNFVEGRSEEKAVN